MPEANTMEMAQPEEGQRKPWRADARANYAKLKTALAPWGMDGGASMKPLRQMNRMATRAMYQMNPEQSSIPWDRIPAPPEGYEPGAGFGGFDLDALRARFADMRVQQPSPFAQMFNGMGNWRKQPQPLSASLGG